MSQRPVPPRGMRDLLPAEVRARRWLLANLLTVYERYGFEQIETPALEDIDRLVGSEGGDNEKLIYKVLKRGLTFEGPPASESDIVDLGLRYDLTVPLARFYATHSADLLQPFRAIQTGPVWRAERPQKGRYRQFVQCDIDVLGDASTAAEIELVCATADALRGVGVDDFTVRINDRRLLHALVSGAGFNDQQAGAVLVAVDKLDKIGLDGVSEELGAIDSSAAQSLVKALSLLDGAKDVDAVADALSSVSPDRTLEEKALEDLSNITAGVAAIRPDVKLVVDATLVRGQGYYTGSIFEVEHNELRGSLAGGGRYDRMIGKLSGIDVPAVGFSIGFERLFDILGSSAGLTIDQRRIALLHAADVPATEMLAVAHVLRDAGDAVRPERAVKNRTSQLKRLEDSGFTHWAEFRPGHEVQIQPFAKEGTR